MKTDVVEKIRCLGGHVWSAADVLGVVENANALEGVASKFELRYDGEPVGQHVQDSFLELYE